MALAVISVAGGLAAQTRVATPAPAGESAQAFAPIAALVNAAIARHELPGAVVLIGRGDTIRYQHAFGQRAVLPAPEPMTEDTIFDLASLTKVVATTTSVMMLVEQGRIRLNDPVFQFIPGFEAHEKRGITIRHLLTHTSGLPPDLELEVEFHGADEAIRRASDETPTSPPGERFVYSDINFFLLGDIVRRVSGESLDRFAAAHIFQPLGMRDTGFLPPAARRARIAPTERCVSLEWPCAATAAADRPFLRGVVHDPTARRMDGVAGHAGLFSTAADLSRFCRMLLDGGRLGSVRILSPATVARMTSPSTPVGMRDVRGLGWDIDSSYSANRGELFPIGSFGHTGFTGTSLWLDPASKSYVVFLSNRVHPDGKGDVTPLRGRVATVAAAALLSADDVASAAAQVARGFQPRESGGPERAALRGETAALPAPPLTTPAPAPRTTAEATPHEVLAGIDVLAAEGFAPLRGKRIGLLTNQTGQSRRGESTIDLLAHAPGVSLVALFSPEHGIRGELDDKVASTKDERTGLPIYSLYGDTRRPTRAMFDGLDTIVVDLQDIGARFYTFPATIGYILEEAARAKVAVIVLDRPNPIDGLAVEGPNQDPAAIGFNGYLRMPIRHGLTHRGAGASVQRGERDWRRLDRGGAQELAARGLVRRDRTALGQPVTEHAHDARRDGVSGHRRARGHQHFGRPRDGHAIRADRRAVDRCDRSGDGAQRRSDTRCALLSDHVHACRWSKTRRTGLSRGVPGGHRSRSSSAGGYGHRDRIGAVAPLRSAVQARGRGAAARIEDDHRENSRRRERLVDRGVLVRRRGRLAGDASEIPTLLKWSLGNLVIWSLIGSSIGSFWASHR